MRAARPAFSAARPAAVATAPTSPATAASTAVPTTVPTIEPAPRRRPIRSSSQTLMLRLPGRPGRQLRARRPRRSRSPPIVALRLRRRPADTCCPVVVVPLRRGECRSTWAAAQVGRPRPRAGRGGLSQGVQPAAGRSAVAACQPPARRGGRRAGSPTCRRTCRLAGWEPGGAGRRCRELSVAVITLGSVTATATTCRRRRPVRGLRGSCSTPRPPRTAAAGSTSTTTPPRSPVRRRRPTRRWRSGGPTPRSTGSDRGAAGRVAGAGWRAVSADAPDRVAATAAAVAARRPADLGRGPAPVGLDRPAGPALGCAVRPAEAAGRGSTGWRGAARAPARRRVRAGDRCAAPRHGPGQRALTSPLPETDPRLAVADPARKSRTQTARPDAPGAPAPDAGGRGLGRAGPGTPSAGTAG